MGFIVAAAFLVVGCFIDAIPAIIIVGTILAPLAAAVGMHPMHFAIIGVISIAFGLVTPPYGLCLMIACAVGGIKVKEAVRDTLMLLVPLLGVLLLVILFPEMILCAAAHAAADLRQLGGGRRLRVRPGTAVDRHPPPTPEGAPRCEMGPTAAILGVRGVRG